MNENILEAVLRLFALVASVDEHGLSPRAREVVLSYLEKQLNQELAQEYIAIFDEYLQKYHPKRKDIIKTRKRISLNSVKVLAICEEINKDLQQLEKVVVLLRLLEFIAHEKITDEEFDFVQTVSDVFNIPRQEFEEIFNFVTVNFSKIPDKQKLLIIDNHKHSSDGYKHIYQPDIHGALFFLYVKSVNLLLVQYHGSAELKLNSVNIEPRRTYLFDSGSFIKGAVKLKPFYYSEIISHFRDFTEKNKIYFLAEDITFTFPKSPNGIHKMTIAETSGKLVGIMGGSGVGKSTLLNLLIGNLKVKTGKITINGRDLYKDKDELEGIIGYVPQDDLLIEELTVFQNLYYNSKLCFKDLSEFQILRLVAQTLKDLDLYEIKDLKVGSPLNKFISGGQRKRLNIALELIRKPAILFVDEPTSGLSSADAEVVMSLLKTLTYQGKLVIINIHQPSSEIYKLFDKIIVIDKGGYPVFYGNPIDAIVYFRQENKIANAEDVVCPTCGNINPDQILELIESKVVDEYGKVTDKRKIPPQKWYELYLKYREADPLPPKDFPKERKSLPETIFKKAGAFKQFVIFSVRNILRKVANIQYVILNLVEAPLLAFILAIFSKYVKGTAEDPGKYIFAENVNIPSFLFMSVVVALFIGMTVSAEEIIKDRKILNREKFLNLSFWSYLNSKVFYLLLLSALQMFLYVIVSNTILEIHGLTFKFWLILFSAAFWGNMMGLVISSSMNSVVTIYISIPLVLIPLLLFSGTVIDFTKLNKNFTSEKYTPFIGDIMVSRWALEAMMVTQFSDNYYEKNIFETEKVLENATYYSTSYYDKITNIINFLDKNKDNEEKAEIVERRFRILNNEIKNTENLTGKNCNVTLPLTPDNFTNDIKNEVLNYFYLNINKKFNEIAQKYRTKRDIIINNLKKQYGDEVFQKMKDDNYNNKVAEFVLNKTEFTYVSEGESELIRHYRPIFQVPDNHYGRAQFYSSEKIIGQWHMKTIWFNTAIIWIYTLILYIVLVSGLFDVNRRVLIRTFRKKDDV